MSAERLADPPNEAAAMLGVSRKTIDKLVRDGELRASKIGSRVLIHRDSLIELLERTQT